MTIDISLPPALGRASAEYRAGPFWLDRRRDQASPRWMIAWYDARNRQVRYRSTRTDDLQVALAALHAFADAPGDVTALSPPFNRPSNTTYFIGGAVGAIKIGVARNVGKRLSELQCGSPIPLAVLATAEGGSAIEREYHRQFAAHRLHGEWFERCPEIEAEIARLAL